MLAFQAFQDERRTARMEQRMSPSTKELIEHAAALQGVSGSEFMVAHSVTAARETISRLETTRLGAEDRAAFMRALDDEALDPALMDVMRLHAQVSEGRK